MQDPELGHVPEHGKLPGVGTCAGPCDLRVFFLQH